MLNYPDNFDTPAFPAGKRISVARIAAICCMSAFFVIICMCGAIWWLNTKKSISPVLIFVDSVTGQWQVAGKKANYQESEYYYVVQKSLVGVFTEKWFNISTNPEKNMLMWGRCNRDEICTNRIEQTNIANSGCDIFCMSDEKTYKDFIEKVVPIYQTRASFGEQWSVNVNTITVSPDGNISENGGQWIVNAHVRAVPGPGFNIIAYVSLARNVSDYPQTLGYYINNFNAYNVQQ